MILRANYPETETERESYRIARGMILVTYINFGVANDSLTNIITRDGFQKSKFNLQR